MSPDTTQHTGSLAPVEAKARALLGPLPAPPDVDNLPPGERWSAMTTYADELVKLRTELWDALEDVRPGETDALIAALDDRHAEVWDALARACAARDAAHNQFDRSVGAGARVDARRQAERRILSAWVRRAPRRRSPARRRLPAAQRRYAPRRPRATATRSSARSGDSGDDPGPACSPRAHSEGRP